MTPSEAVAACEFWTTNLAESRAMGTTSTQEIGETLNGQAFDWERATRPGERTGWAINVGRWMQVEGENGEKEQVENPLYAEIATEIAARA